MQPLFLLVAAVFFWAAKYHPFLDVPRVVDDDARQHVYWTYAFQDTDLFRDDILTAFISSPKVAPLGYQALYFVGGQLMDPLLFSQLLSLLLLIFSVYLLYKTGQDMGGSARGSAFAALLFLLYFLYSSSGGLPKSFAFPLLLSSIFLALRGSCGGIAALLCVQSLLYPPILLNSLALAAGVGWRTWQRGTGRCLWRRLVILGVGVGLAGSVLFGVYAVASQQSWGPLITPGQARTMPEFSAQGRTAFYGKTVWQTALNDRAGIGGVRLIGFVVLIMGMSLVNKRSGLVMPRLVTELVLTSLALFGGAHLVLFKLHLPSRYVLYTLPVAALLVIAVNGATTVTALQAQWPRLGRLYSRLTPPRRLRWALLGGLALAFVYIQNRYIVAHDPLAVSVDSTAMHLYRYMQTLPKDALIAGHPVELDNIPLFARRKVLVNQELSLPYYTGYYAEVRRRLHDALLAYYTEDVREVWRFVQHYGVDYMLVNTQHFTPQFFSGTLYYEPFNSLVRQRLSAHPRFALLQDGVWQRVYTNGPYILVSFKQGSH
jgi:hypothetical protein